MYNGKTREKGEKGAGKKMRKIIAKKCPSLPKSNHLYFQEAQ